MLGRALWSHGRSEVGGRATNQDTYHHGVRTVSGGRNVLHRGVSSSAPIVLAVCDGMGGHAAGEIAATLARDALVDALADGRMGTPASRVEAAVRRAHEAVLHTASGQAALAGMGTTCVVAVVHGAQAVVANVGDSRAYLMRGGRLSQITQDHTQAQLLLAQGLITRAEYDQHPKRSVLVQALGQREPPVPHLEMVALELGDTLLLCSDGLHESLSVAEITMMMGLEDPVRCAEALVNAALHFDGTDNITAVVARVVVDPASGLGGASNLEYTTPGRPIAAAHPFEGPKADGQSKVCWVTLAALLLGLAYLAW